LRDTTPCRAGDEAPSSDRDAGVRPRRRGRISLAAKFNLVFIALFAANSLAIGGFVSQALFDADRDAAIRFGRVHAEAIARRVEDAIHRGDDAALEAILGRLRDVPDAAYVEILDARGEVLASEHFRRGFDVPPFRPDARARSGAPRLTELTDSSDGGIVSDLLLPLASSAELLARLEPGAQVPRVIGYLRLGLDDHWAQERTREFAVTASGLAALLALAGVALTALVVRHLARPLRHLAVVTREVADGDFDQQVKVGTGDEVGELAASLDVMLARLRDYRSQVENHQRNLEQEVDVRTMELLQRSEQAQELARQAQEANRAKTQFLANMSHEIRTPMNGVLGMTELLLETELDSTQHRFTGTIHESARILLGLLDDLLDYSRSEAGKLELEQRDFDLRDAIEETADLLAEQAQGKGLELVCFIDEEVPRAVRSDPVRLRQILTNLIGNAVKFTEAGEVVVRAVRAPGGVEPTADRDTCFPLEITVTDTGIGIPEDASERIFESFTQADGSMARRFGGVGLGLAISKQLAELMGGEIGFDTEAGRGSRFWVRLPVECVDPTPSDADATWLAGQRIHVVDASVTHRSILAHQLRAWGAEVDTPEPQDALAAILRGASQASLAIVDPTSTGASASEWASALAQRSEPIRLVLLSSVGDKVASDGIPENALHLARPTRRADVERVLREACASRGANPERAVAQDERPASGARFEARVLLVEDNDINRRVATAMLEALGCRVVEAASGRAGLGCHAQEPFDLVFMDCQMPGIDGFEALTAHAGRADRDECLRAGMDDYLSKPFTKEALESMLRRWLPECHAARSDSSQDDAAVDTSAGAASTETPLTRDALRQLRLLDPGGAQGLVAHVVDTYLESSDGLRRSICEASRSGDATALARAAHTLKSSSAQVGAEGVSALCKEIEALGRAGQLDGAAELVARLDSDLEAVWEALAAERFGARDD
jgi:signal transduction histidine kinase/DNA-binding response OmpR family regulator